MLRSLAIQNYNFKLTPEINNPTYSGKSPTFVHINMAAIRKIYSYPTVSVANFLIFHL